MNTRNVTVLKIQKGRRSKAVVLRIDAFVVAAPIILHQNAMHALMFMVTHCEEVFTGILNRHRKLC